MVLANHVGKHSGPQPIGERAWHVAIEAGGLKERWRIALGPRAHASVTPECSSLVGPWNRRIGGEHGPPRPVCCPLSRPLQSALASPATCSGGGSVAMRTAAACAHGRHSARIAHLTREG